MFNFIPLVFASFMAGVDAILLALLKGYSLGNITWPGGILFIMIGYSIQPLIFLQSLQYETMTVMNILWDVLSDVIVTSIGLLYFKEKLSILKIGGLIFAFIAVVLFSYEELV
jgi:drug/metabolite transporter (DMT)-like permease